MLRTDDGVVVASEPYDDDPRWSDVPDHHLVDITAGAVTTHRSGGMTDASGRIASRPIPAAYLEAPARRRARRTDRDSEDPAAQVLLRCARQRAVRRDHPAARVLPDQGRDVDPASSARPRSPPCRGASRSSSWAAGPRPRPGCCCGRCSTAGRCASSCPSTSTRPCWPRPAPRWRPSTLACGSSRSSVISSVTSATIPAARPAHDRVPRLHHRQSRARRPGPASSSRSVPRCGPATPSCSAPTWSRTRTGCCAPTTTPPGVTAEFNRNVLRGHQPRAGRRLRRRGVPARRRLERRPASGSRCGCARQPRAAGHRSAPSDLTVSFAAGEEMRTEISAKFRREKIEAELAAAGLQTLRFWTDPAGDFGLTLARPAP